MKKDNFIKLLERNSPKEILEFVKRYGKKPKSINPIYFFDDNGNRVSSK